MQDIKEIVNKQRTYFHTGQTLPVNTRILYLKKLYRSIQAHEADIIHALHADLGKSETEAFMCEAGLTLSELSHQIRHIRHWASKSHKHTDLTNFPARSYTICEPYGVVLVMAPWNYPFMLTIEPAIGAIAAGNCCVLKPSAYSPATSAVISAIVKEVFPPEYVTVVEGGRAENTELLNQRFDYIFFTGGVTVGKLVMQKAAAHLTPVTLELGGKSPCIVEKSCNLKIAARRLVFGKYLNCGQTCVAPDYVLVDESIKDRFLALVKKEITSMYGERPLENAAYGKMINQKHFDRVSGLLLPEKVVFGGQTNPETLQIEPTVMDHVSPEDAIMQEEIFGPVLPILTYRDIREAEQFITSREKPLAFYLFTSDKGIERRLLRHISFGGGCVNDTIMHMTTSAMGFGGVGNSGMGSYHGKKSFDTFSHEKSILKKSTLIDMPMRYAPYKKIWLTVIRLLLR